MAIGDAVRSLGIEGHAGSHTGECEVCGDDIGGMARILGARVGALAGPNDVLSNSRSAALTNSRACQVSGGLFAVASS